MLAKRVIPCLDVDAGRVVKGVRFQQLRDAGDPVAAGGALRPGGRRRARVPRHHGDARGSGGDPRRGLPHGRGGLHPAHRRRRRADRRRRAGAPAGRSRQGEREQRRRARPVAPARGAPTGSGRSAWSSRSTRSGATGAGRSTSMRATPGRIGTRSSGRPRPPTRHGAGEVLVTSMDRDGTGEGYDLDLLRAIAGAVAVPVIASGGAGEPAHFAEALTDGRRRRRARRIPLARRRPHDPRGQGAPRVPWDPGEALDGAGRPRRAHSSTNEG